MIEDMVNAADSLSRAAPTPVRILEAAAKGPESAAGVAARQRTKREVRVARQRVASKPARHAKMERVAVKSAQPVKAEPKSAEHAKTGRVTAKPARDAKLGHRKGTGRTIGAPCEVSSFFKAREKILFA
jgi:hypothetical protein